MLLTPSEREQLVTPLQDNPRARGSLGQPRRRPSPPLVASAGPGRPKKRRRRVIISGDKPTSVGVVPMLTEGGGNATEKRPKAQGSGETAAMGRSSCIVEITVQGEKHQ